LTANLSNRKEKSRPMHCQKCQFWVDTQDDFCRKCGTPLASEANFYEYTPEPALASAEVDSALAEELREGEIVEVAQTNALELAPASPPALALKSEPKHPVLALAKKALTSTEGRALAKSAAVLAVGVGLELLAQARSKHGRSALIKQPPTSLAENLSQSLGDLLEPTKTAAGTTTITETWIYRYTYIRRTTQRGR
jgi:hypothetical protein